MLGSRRYRGFRLRLDCALITTSRGGTAGKERTSTQYEGHHELHTCAQHQLTTRYNSVVTRARALTHTHALLHAHIVPLLNNMLGRKNSPPHQALSSWLRHCGRRLYEGHTHKHARAHTHVHTDEMHKFISVYHLYATCCDTPKTPQKALSTGLLRRRRPTTTHNSAWGSPRWLLAFSSRATQLHLAQPPLALLLPPYLHLGFSTCCPGQPYSCGCRSAGAARAGTAQ